MVFLNFLSFLFSFFLQIFELTAEDETLRCDVRVSAVPISSKFVHFFIEIVNRQGVLFGLACQQFFRLICLLEGNEVVVLLDIIIALDGQGSNISLRIDVDTDGVRFELFAQSIELVLAAAFHSLLI